MTNKQTLNRFQLLGTSTGLPKSAASAAYARFDAAKPDGAYHLDLSVRVPTPTPPPQHQPP